MVDDLLLRLSKAEVFSVLDARNGFWQLDLVQKSSMLTTMTTPFGRYRWLRMPLGESLASEIFQEKLDQAIERLNGIFAIFDDILVVGGGV